ncbi:hypothetical protein NA56DRAFT_700769 [Hyaloscypha hepaticicola]|uniref:Uncharacterized protein n=1 Tax=Hyaloscypha hepaticicola TaxID=2082293 RepID=A0A2J6QDF5_9HELO|nr:hypothetical protein NA56DRAFT_700769 [Hyaloscypha hepaticicola]
MARHAVKQFNAQQQWPQNPNLPIPVQLSSSNASHRRIRLARESLSLSLNLCTWALTEPGVRVRSRPLHFPSAPLVYFPSLTATLPRQPPLFFAAAFCHTADLRYGYLSLFPPFYRNIDRSVIGKVALRSGTRRRSHHRPFRSNNIVLSVCHGPPVQPWVYDTGLTVPPANPAPASFGCSRFAGRPPNGSINRVLSYETARYRQLLPAAVHCNSGGCLNLTPVPARERVILEG